MSGKPVKVTPASKISLSVLILAIISFMLYKWIVAPQAGYLHATQQYEETVSNAEKKKDLVKLQIGNKKKKLEKLKEEITHIESSFFTPEKAKEFFLDLEPLALQCSCFINSQTSISTVELTNEHDEEEKKSDVILKSLTIGMNGQYGNLIDFMQRLNNYSQRISITNLHIESMNIYNKELECYMTITIYLIQSKEFESYEQK